MKKEIIGMYLKAFQEPLNLTEKVILNYLLNTKNRNYWNIEEIGERLGISRQTVSKALLTLEKEKYIKREKVENKRYYLTKLTAKSILLTGKTAIDEKEYKAIEFADGQTVGEFVSDYFEKMKKGEIKIEKRKNTEEIEFDSF